MGSERHSLRKQSFRVSAGSEDIALALQARLPELNRTILIDAIETVLDSYSSPARHIRIDRLRVDLGTIVLGRNFDEDVKTRLERELRQALDAAVYEIASQPGGGRLARSRDEARLDLLEHYLTNGTLPFWAAAPAFDVEALVTETATATPDALIRLLRRHRHASQVTRRLVAQLSDQVLGQLLDLIDPGSTGRVSGEAETARREDRRFATWVRILTDAVFEHRDAAGGVARDAAQSAGGSAERSGREGPEASPLEGPDISLEERDLSPGAQLTPPRDGPDLSRYGEAEAIRYYVRYGVLPWTAALAKGAAGGVLRLEALLDTLPGLPLSVLRTIFTVRGSGSPAALVRAVEQMSADTRARLLAALRVETQSHEVPVDAPAIARVIEQPAAYVRTILRMLHGGAEGTGETLEWPTAPAPDEWRALLSEVHWVKSILVERARRGERAGPPDVSSAALLQLLVEKHPADAGHFFRVLREARIAPATLLTEPVSPRLFVAAQMLLPASARTIVSLLLRLVSRLPAHQQPGGEAAVRTAAMGAVLDHVTVAGRTESRETRVNLAAGLLCALFGPVMAADTVEELATDAAQLARDGEIGAEDLETVSGALGALGYADSPAVYPTDIETDVQDTFEQRIAQLPAAAAHRVASLVRIVSAWPSGERLAGQEKIKRAIAGVLDDNASADPLGRGFLAAVLQAVLGPHVTAAVAGRLLDDVERVAARGDLTRTDVEVMSEAVASLTGARPHEAPEAERIAAVLTARLDGSSSAESGVPSSASLLRTLIERFPHDARAFLQKIRNDGFLPSTLLAGVTAPDLLEPVAALLRPLDRRLVAIILRVVSVLPAAERPGSGEATRTALAGVVLDHPVSTSNGEVLAAAAMRRLFGTTMPEAVQRRLVAEVERAGRTGQVGPDAVTVFLRVLGRPEDARGDAEDLEGSAPDAALSAVDASTDQIEQAEPTSGSAAAVSGEAPATGHVSTVPPGLSASEPADHLTGLPAESVAAALARLRGPAQIAREMRASAEQVPAQVSDQPAAPPRLYQPSRFPRRAPPAAAPASGEPAASEKVPARTAAPEHTTGADGGRERLSDDALRHILLELVETSPAAVREFLVEGLADKTTRDGWVRSFTEPELARIIWLLEPARHRLLIAAAELLFAAWDTAAPGRMEASSTRRALWAFVLDVLSRHPTGERSLDNLVPEFFAHVGVNLEGAGALHDRGETAERIFADAVRLAERKGHAHLRAVLSHQRSELMALATGQGRVPASDSGERSRTAIATKAPPSDWVPSSTSSRQRTAFSMDEERLEADGEPIHVTNAGLVIVGVFLPQFFALLDVLEEKPTGGTRVRPDAVSRTVHLLQHLVDERTDTPEPLLSLNKVLCGVPLAVPIDREIEISVRERELCDSLLKGLLQQWTIIKDSSIAALRETYLQREGRLDHLPTGWRLRVQRKTVDQLMDYMPWPVTTVAHSWMAEPLYVTW